MTFLVYFLNMTGTLLMIEKGYIGEHEYQASILKNNKNLRTH